MGFLWPVKMIKHYGHLYFLLIKIFFSTDALLFQDFDEGTFYSSDLNFKFYQGSAGHNVGGVHW